MSRRAITLSLVGLVPVASASADLAFSFDVSNVVTPINPSTTVEVWAHFDPGYYAFAGAQWDVTASADVGGFSDAFSILNTYGTSDGNISQDGDFIAHIIAGQLQFPLGNYFADTTNPILVWKATWSTDFFKPRSVNISTATQKCFLYLDDSGLSNDFYDDAFQEAIGSIQVVPAPAAGALLGVLALTVRRRRA